MRQQVDIVVRIAGRRKRRDEFRPKPVDLAELTYPLQLRLKLANYENGLLVQSSAIILCRDAAALEYVQSRLKDCLSELHQARVITHLPPDG